MTRSLLSRRRRGGRSMLRSHLIDAGEALLCRFASRASIRWLRDVDRPPRRSLSNELLIARGTPPNLGGEFSKPRTNGQSPVPSSERRGGCAIKKMLRSLLMKAQTGWSVPDNVSTSTFTIMTTPSAPLRRLRVFFLLAQPPLLFQEGNTLSCNSFKPS